MNLKLQKSLNCQRNLDEKEQSWSYHGSWLQTIVQSYNDQNNKVLAQKKTHYNKVNNLDAKNKFASELNREPRNKPTHSWTINLWQMRQKYTMEKYSLFHNWCWGNGTATCKRMKSEYFLYHIKKYTQNRLKT